MQRRVLAPEIEDLAIHLHGCAYRQAGLVKSLFQGGRHEHRHREQDIKETIVIHELNTDAIFTEIEDEKLRWYAHISDACDGDREPLNAMATEFFQTEDAEVGLKVRFDLEACVSQFFQIHSNNGVVVHEVRPIASAMRANFEKIIKQIDALNWDDGPSA